MDANFTPNYTPVKTTGQFKFWCQKVLPLVYDDSLSYYELLCKVVNYLNDVISNVDIASENTRRLYEAFISLQNYVNNYFDDLNVVGIINDKLDEMANDGTLNALLNNLKKKYLIISDSYGAGGTQSGAVYTTFVEFLVANSKLDIVSNCWSGAGFASSGDGKSFIDLVKEYQGDKNVITDIYVVGGYNDLTKTEPEIYNGMSEFIEYVRANYPSAKVWCAPVGWSWFATDYPLLNRMVSTYMNGAFNGMGCVTNINYVMHNLSYFDSDHIHPNRNGQLAIAEKLCGHMLGGGVRVSYPRTEVPYGAGAEGFTISLWHELNDGIVSITHDTYETFDFTPFGSRQWGSGATIPITTEAPYGYVRGFNDTKITLPCYFKVGATWHSGYITLNIINGVVYLGCDFYIDDGGYTGIIDSLRIPPFQFSVPADVN